MQISLSKWKSFKYVIYHYFSKIKKKDILSSSATTDVGINEDPFSLTPVDTYRHLCKKKHTSAQETSV